MRLLDYSAGHLSGDAIRRAGYQGAIRYIDTPSTWATKHTNVTEYTDLIRHGLTVLLVYEHDTNDPLRGRAGGITAAHRALAGAHALGYPEHLPIFFCFDRHATPPEMPVWRAYLDGAASVLGRERVGAYGFGEAIDGALGHASFLWQCGSRHELRPTAHLYQNNNITTRVAGIPCDINEVLRPLTPHDSTGRPAPSTQEGHDDMHLNDKLTYVDVTGKQHETTVGHALGVLMAQLSNEHDQTSSVNGNVKKLLGR